MTNQPSADNPHQKTEQVQLDDLLSERDLDKLSRLVDRIELRIKKVKIRLQAAQLALEVELNELSVNLVLGTVIVVLMKVL